MSRRKNKARAEARRPETIAMMLSRPIERHESPLIVPTFIDDVAGRIDAGHWSCVVRFHDGHNVCLDFDPPTHPMDEASIEETVRRLYAILDHTLRFGLSEKTGLPEEVRAPRPELLWFLNEELVCGRLRALVAGWLAARLEWARTKAAEGRSPADVEAEILHRNTLH